MNESISGPGAGKRPSLAVFAIIERKDAMKPYWMRIGTALPNKDGSLTLLMDAYPTGSTRLQVRESRPYDEARTEARRGGTERHALMEAQP